MVDRTKRCRVCGEEKELGDFYRMKGMRDGHRNDCKACNLVAKKLRYQANPRAAIERTKTWQRENRERHRETQRRIRAQPERKRAMRAGYLKRTYGITLDEYDAMLAAQGGRCAICRRTPRGDISLHVDHDHGSGGLRGLLCFSCNQSIGSMAEDPDRFLAAAAYLDAHDPEAAELTAIARERARALV